MSKDKVPGSYKSKATFKSDVHERPMVKDIPANTSDVSDELYSYTTDAFPSYINSDIELQKGVREHVKHNSTGARRE